MTTMNNYMSNHNDTTALYKKRSSAVTMTPIRSEQKQRNEPLTPTAHRTTTRFQLSSLSTMTPSLRFNPCVSPAVVSFTGDRFIPNRAKIETTRIAQSERKLRRSLFSEVIDDDDKNDTERVLSFGSNENSTDNTNCNSDNNIPGRVDPNQLDILRSETRHNVPYHHSRRHRRHHHHRKSTLRACAHLSGRGMLADDILSLVHSNGNCVAFCIDNCVWLSRTIDDKMDTVELLKRSNNGEYTAVKWSQCGTYVAIGGYNLIEIYHPAYDSDGEHVLLQRIELCEGYVTSIAWNQDSTEIVAAGHDGIKRFRVGDELPWPISTYQNHGEDDVVTSMEWKNHKIVTAGGGTIHIWQEEQHGTNVSPRLVLDHPGVKTVQGSPFHPHLLVSGGDGGLKIWNIHNGSLHGTIATEECVVGCVLLNDREEVVIAHGSKLSAWNIGTRMAIKLAETSLEEDDVMCIALAEAVQGKIACVTNGETIIGYQLDRPFTKKTRNLLWEETGTLKMPVIR